MSFKDMMERYKTGQVTEEEKRVIEEELEKFSAINDFEYERLDINLGEFHEENTQSSEAENLTRAIKKEMRATFVRIGTITGIAAVTVVLFVTFALPNIVSTFYYDPGKTASEKKIDGDATIGFNQMSMDIAVYTEMIIPEAVRSAVDVYDKGYGKYDICIRQTIASGSESFHDISGKVERNKLVLYDPNVLKPMTANAFGWTQRENTEKSLRYQDKLERQQMTNKNEHRVHGVVDGRDAAQYLNDLDGKKSYYAYVTLDRMMEYEDFYKFFKRHEELTYGWCAVKTTDVNEDRSSFSPANIGFVFNPNYSEEIEWDRDRYPALFLESGGNWDVFNNEDYAAEHFVSMLSYMEDNREFYEMISPDTEGHDFTQAREYVQKNGIKVYGFVTFAKKNVLQKLMEEEEIYSVYVNEH